MTREALAITPSYPINGVGPYQYSNPYTLGALRAFVELDDTLIALELGEYFADPLSSNTSGSIALTTPAASAYNGGTLYILRQTDIEQGFSGQSARENGLAAQLDWMTEAIQDTAREVRRSLRSTAPIDPFPIKPGRILTANFEGDGFTFGPTFDDITQPTKRPLTAKTIPSLAAMTTLVDGQQITVESGANGEPEPYTYDRNSTLIADGALIVDPVGMGVGRLVSKRTVIQSISTTDRRTFAAGTDITIAYGGAIIRAVTSGGTITNAGGQQFVVVTGPSFSERSSAALTELAAYPDGTVGNIGAYQFKSNSAKTGDLSAGSDLGVAGIEAIGILNKFVPEMWGGGTDKSAATNTAVIRRMLLAIPTASTLLFLWGTYPVTSQDDYVFTLTRNINIEGTNRSGLRGDSCANTTSMWGIAITSNDGFTEVRGWHMRDAHCGFNGGGLHAVHVFGGFTLNNCAITDCGLFGNNTNGGKSFIDTSPNGNWQHSSFERNTCGSPIYMACGDANVFRKNNVFASSGGPAFTFDLVPGVRNNVVEDNTLVCRDGALHVIDGDEVRFVNNQIEQFQTFGENQSTPSASVYLQGATRPVGNCVIEKNNFGGGLNVDYSIYIDNAQHTVITKNSFFACDIDDIHLTVNSRYNIFEFDNNMRESALRLRSGNPFKVKITDNSQGWNIQTPRTLGGQNGWNTVTVYKDKQGFLTFVGDVFGGTTAANTLMYYLPAGFWGVGASVQHFGGQGGLGAGRFKVINTNGQIQVVSVAGNGAHTMDRTIRAPINTTDW